MVPKVLILPQGFAEIPRVDPEVRTEAVFEGPKKIQSSVWRNS